MLMARHGEAEWGDDGMWGAMGVRRVWCVAGRAVHECMHRVLGAMLGVWQTAMRAPWEAGRVQLQQGELS